MTEIRNVAIKVFRDHDGHPTCCKYIVDQQCQFLTTRKMGSVEICGFTDLDLRRGGMTWVKKTMRWLGTKITGSGQAKGAYFGQRKSSKPDCKPPQAAFGRFFFGGMG